MGHFYDPRTRELVDGNLRDARKVGGLPSPTTVLGLLQSPGLTYYFRRCMWEAARTTPRQPGWSDDEDFAACLRWADEHGKVAREKGGSFHDLVQQFHESTLGLAAMPMAPPEFYQQYDAYLCWYDANVEKTLLVEEVVIGDGYAGRVDHVAKLRDGRNVVMDVKTQDRKRRAGFNHYETHGLQLGAYAGTVAVASLGIDALISIYVSSNEPVVLEAFQWERPWQYYHGLFLGLRDVWCFTNNYYPHECTTILAANEP